MWCDSSQNRVDFDRFDAQGAFIDHGHRLVLRACPNLDGDGKSAMHSTQTRGECGNFGNLERLARWRHDSADAPSNVEMQVAAASPSSVFVGNTACHHVGGCGVQLATQVRCICMGSSHRGTISGGHFGDECKVCRGRSCCRRRGVCFSVRCECPSHHDITWRHAATGGMLVPLRRCFKAWGFWCECSVHNWSDKKGNDTAARAPQAMANKPEASTRLPSPNVISNVLCA